MSSHVKRYSSSNLFDECILVLSTWREATSLLRWISALPSDKTNILQDFTWIIVKQDKLGDSSATDTMQLHHEAHALKKQGFSNLFQLAQTCPVTQIKNKKFSFRSDLTYLTHSICLISLEYDNLKPTKIISKISCKLLIYKDQGKEFCIEGSDEKTNIEGLYKFCKDNLAGKSATLVSFSVCNTIMMLIGSLQRHSLYDKFCDLFSSFTDLHTIMRDKCPEYKCQLPDFDWICNYLEVGSEFQKIEEVSEKMFHILQMLFEPTLHESIQKHTCPISMMYQSTNPVVATIKLQTELAFEDGETIQQIFNHSLGKHLGKLHVSESMHKYLKIKVLDLTEDILTLELTNVSSSMVLANGENIVKLFAYAEPFAIHSISNMAKSSVDKFRSLPIAPKLIQEANGLEHTSNESNLPHSNPIFGRSISMSSQKMSTKKLEIKADTEIILFPKQSKTIEMDFKELRTSPLCKVNIEKNPENLNFVCKLNDNAELVFGKLTFVVVSQTKAKLVLPVGHCFGFLHLDPSHRNVDDIQISVTRDPLKVDTLESSQSIEEEEAMDVSDLDVSTSSLDLRNERNILVRELENLNNSENISECEPPLVENQINQDITPAQMNDSALDTNKTLTKESTATIMQCQSESKFIFSDKVQGYNDLIVAAKSYISNNRDNGIDDDTLEAIVYALQSLSIINSSFTTFKSIIEVLTKSSKFNKSQIISTLNTNSMNLFSKIMTEKFIGPFMSILSHELSEACGQQIADSGDEMSKDLTVTDTPGKGNGQLNSSQAISDSELLSPLSQKGPKKKGKNKNEESQQRRESTALNSGKSLTNDNQLPPLLFANSIGSSELVNQSITKSAVEQSSASVENSERNVVEQPPASSVSTVTIVANTSVSTSTMVSLVNTTSSPTVTVPSISSSLDPSSSLILGKVSSAASTSNIATTESDKNTAKKALNKNCNVTSNTALSALSDTKTIASNQNTTKNQPEGSTDKIIKCTSIPKYSNTVPDPRRYFVNLHVGEVVSITDTVRRRVWFKTIKGIIDFELKTGFDISLTDKVLLQLDGNQVKWFSKMTNWNSMKNCYIGKVVEINNKLKVFILEYKNGCKAKLNQLRIKKFAGNNIDIKIGSLFWIYVFSNQPLVVSLAILKEEDTTKCSKILSAAKASDIEAPDSEPSSSTPSKVVKGKVSEKGNKNTDKATNAPNATQTNIPEIVSTFNDIGALTYLSDNLGILETKCGKFVAFHRNIHHQSLAYKNLLSTTNNQVKLSF